MVCVVGLEWSSVRLTLHHDEVSQSKWWQVDEVVTGQLLKHEFNSSTSSPVSSTSSPVSSSSSLESRAVSHRDVLVNPFLSIVSFSERVPTGVLSIFDNYGSVNQLSFTAN